MPQPALLAELKRRNLHRAAAVYVGLAWLVLQVADTLLPAFGFGDRAMRGLVIALAVGFVPAMIAAWSFELTPEGIRREAEVASGSALERRTNRLLDRLFMVVLALGLAYFAVDKFVLDPARDAELVSEAREQAKSAARLESYGDKSIVVLPFDNLSADPEQEYLSDGLAEELLNLLAKIPELRVISRTSAFSYKGKDVKIAEIARDLDVAHVLEGSVRRSGNRLRITAQLIDARTDTHLWSEVYDRELADVFAIQDEIAGHVTEELKLRLLGGTRPRRRVDPQAYLLFLQARHDINQDLYFTQYQQILDRLNQALAIDPTLLEAWIGISRLNFLVNMHSPMPEAPPDWPGEQEAYRLGLEALDRAAAIDPDSPPVIGFRAFQRGVVDLDFASAAPELERALRLEPGNIDILLWGSYFARTLRRPEVAIRLIERQWTLDPRCGDCAPRLQHTLVEAGRLDEAKAMILRRRMQPGAEHAGWYSLGVIELLRGDAAAALVSFGSGPSDGDGPSLRAAGRAMALHALGRQEQARAASAEFERRVPRGMSQVRGELYARTGRPEQAIEVFAGYFPKMKHAAQRGIAAASPLLRPLEDDPRWIDLLRRHSIDPDDLRAVPFEVTLPALEVGAAARPAGAAM